MNKLIPAHIVLAISAISFLLSGCEGNADSPDLPNYQDTTSTDSSFQDIIEDMNADDNILPDGPIDSTEELPDCTDFDGDGFSGTGPCNPETDIFDCNDTAEEIYPGAVELCDGLDNNCDGEIDESVENCCNPGQTRSCGQEIGQCTQGLQTCDPNRAWGACVGAVEPSEEICDGLDNDCDRRVDEDNSDLVLNLECYTGPQETRDRGLCHQGIQTCQNGRWSHCFGEVLPSAEICDGLDNDCDNEIDEEENGDSLIQFCYSGPPETRNIGQCEDGIQMCREGSFAECLREGLPEPEFCDGLDNDCDGEIDEDANDCCVPGEIRDCGSEQGTCTPGVQTCTSERRWSDCEGAILPEPEVCDGLDNNCNGFTDLTEQQSPLSQNCYTGPPETVHIGECHGGTQFCQIGTWGTCQNQQLPIYEVCDLLDNNCNGEIDESSTGEPLSRDCYTGPEETRNIGNCHDGLRSCIDGIWRQCVQQQLPEPEICDGLDNDCDGEIDNTLWPDSPYEYEFSNTSYIYELWVASPDEECCLDVNGDGSVDNRLGEVLQNLASMGFDLNTGVQTGIRNGSIVLLLEHHCQTGIEDNLSFPLAVFSGTDTDTSYTNNLQGDEEFTVNEESFSINQLGSPTGEPSVILEASVERQQLTAGPGQFPVSFLFFLGSDLPGEDNDITIMNAIMSGELTMGRFGVEIENGTLGGAIPLEQILNRFNDFYMGECSCLGLEDSPMITWNTDDGIYHVSCETNIDWSGCSRNCSMMALACSFLVDSLNQPDISLNNNGLLDALSIGVRFSATSGILEEVR